jgi:hypothetical protein
VHKHPATGAAAEGLGILQEKGWLNRTEIAAPVPAATETPAPAVGAPEVTK